jgi:hypothetical protein
MACGFAPTALATESPGFAKEFISRVGDLNGDGRLDIFLQEKKPKIVPIALDDMVIPIPLRPDVGEFVLQQNSSGQFDLISNLTQQAKQAVKQWAIDQAIEILRKDFNLDGIIDVLLGDVGSVIPGGKNVIVFASPDMNGAPSVVRNVDSVLDQFIKDVGGFSDNPNYFASGVYVQCYTIYIRTLHYDSYTLEYYYTYDPYWICDYYFDPSGFSIPAINFLNKLVPVANSGQLVAQTGDAISISQQLRDMFGIDFFRNALQEGGIGGVPWCEGVPWPELEPCAGYGRLGGLVEVLRDLAAGARDAVSCSVGVPHFYSMSPGNGALSQCEIGDQFCSKQIVYHEQLTHPVTGYLRNGNPIREGQRGTAEVAFPGSWDDGGPIIFHVDKPRFWHQNKTLEGHAFHPGTVSRQTVEHQGEIYITTVGTGTGPCATFNNIVGISAFSTVDLWIKSHVFANITSNHAPIP